MASVEKSSSPSMEIKTHGRFLNTQIALRSLAAAFALTSLSVMVTSHQTVSIFGFNLSARYSYSSAFKFLLIVDAVVAASSLFSLVFVFLFNRSGSHINNYFLLFLHDLVMVVLMMSGCAAATAIGYVGQYGQEKSGWVAICDRVSNFCNKMMVSSVFAYLAFFVYMSLTVLSAYKLMSRPTFVQ